MPTLVTDELWAEIRPLLPAYHPSPRLPVQRSCNASVVHSLSCTTVG